MPKVQLESAGCTSFLGRGGWAGTCRPGEILKYGPLRMHFQHSGAKITVFDPRSQTSLNFGFLLGDST